MSIWTKLFRKQEVPKEMSAQDSIPFERMFPDGICRVKDGYYTKTIQFTDINYQLAQQEDKTAIFEEWCSFLNFFDSSINFELTFLNCSTDAKAFARWIRIPFKKDRYNSVRSEYSGMLKEQMERGNNGLTKTKYITFGLYANSMKEAKPKLIHVETDLLNNFKRIGVQARLLNGRERLSLMHQIFHLDGQEKFVFDWKNLVPTGTSVKDYIAPSAFAFNKNRTFQMGNVYGAMSCLAITASDVSDRMLADFLNMESSQIVTMHIRSLDQNAAIKTVKHKITELDRSKIEEQKKAVRSGYDMDIIPSDLATYGRDAKELLKELQSQNERMFLVTFLFMNTGATEQELENNVWVMNELSQLPVSGWVQSSFSSGALVIKEEAFENMKNDPEFEEYVLNRVRSLYSANGLPIGSNNVCYEVIGGSPEECYGYAGPVGGGNANIFDKDESWWKERHEEFEELLETQAKAAYKKAQLNRALAKEEYLNNQFENSQRLRAFLESRMQERMERLGVLENAGVVAMVTTAYEKTISLTSGMDKFTTE